MPELILPSEDDLRFQVNESILPLLPDGRVDLHRFIAFAQQCCTDHVEKLGLGEAYQKVKRFYYVICRMKGTFLAPLKDGQKIYGITYPRYPDAVQMYRYLYCLDEEKKPIFVLSSLWILLDPDTRRIKPCRFMKEDMQKVIPTLSEIEPLDEEPLRGMDFSGYDLKPVKTYTVEQADIDKNLHMNNTVYLREAEKISSLPSFRTFEIDFERECYLGEKLLLKKETLESEEAIAGYKENSELSFKIRFSKL